MSQTIVAQATAPGLAGLSVIRISGDDAFTISDKCFKGKTKIVDARSHTILYGFFSHDNVVIDGVTASIFHAPHSYTGENIVEFGVHGGTIIPLQVIQTLIEHGCRHSEPGEFTKRAFVNGKINLVQAEAVADIIHAISIPSASISAKQIRHDTISKLSILREKLLDIASIIELEMDFSEEEINLTNSNNMITLLDDAIKMCTDLTNSYKAASILREGFIVAIVGKPNAGKSTLFNSLLNKKRSIVSPIPGTTRDYIAEYIYLNDIAIKLIDTAGLRNTNDIVEIEGIEYSHKVLEESNLVLLINDCSESCSFNEMYNTIVKKYNDKHIIVLQNKMDLVEHKHLENVNHIGDIYYISATSVNSLENLRARIGEIATQYTFNNSDILLNERQYHKLSDALLALNAAKILIEQNAIGEIISIEIRNAGRMLGELTGETWSEDVLNNIFSKFCIGK